jgi:hypothetical protein
MSGLPSYGTGWTETELLMDVLTTYNSWNGEDQLDFDTVRQRLSEKLTDDELVTLSSIVEAFGMLIAGELARRRLPTH